MLLMGAEMEENKLISKHIRDTWQRLAVSVEAVAEGGEVCSWTSEEQATLARWGEYKNFQ